MKAKNVTVADCMTKTPHLIGSEQTVNPPNATSTCSDGPSVAM